MESKRIVITGASRGFGSLTAKTLIERGHEVVATMREPEGRNKERAEELRSWAQDKPGKLQIVELDVTRDDSVSEAIAQIEAEGSIDVLVNNAGVMPMGLTEGFSIEQMRETFEVNLYGVARMTRAVLPSMRANEQGLLVHVSSAGGRVVMPLFGVYCATKFALEAWCESIHHEVESFGVESVIVEPSAFKTDIAYDPPGPSDTERVASYGPLAGGRERLLGMFHGGFEQHPEGSDAQHVADAIAGVIEGPSPRPLRVAVGQDMGQSAINELSAPVQAQFVANLRPVYAGG